MDLAQILADNLKANKLKVTPQRLAIYNYLANTTCHPTVETIYNNLKDDFPAMSLATIYKTVASLRDAHLIREYNFSEDFNRYDANVKRHFHVVCTKCHSVKDYHASIDLSKNINELNNYEINDYDINFYGICDKCREDQK